jgi:hypothetical protein
MKFIDAHYHNSLIGSTMETYRERKEKRTPHS